MSFRSLRSLLRAFSSTGGEVDYFQGVVLEYLRADRTCFVNPEFWIRGNPTSPHDKPHWFVDVLAVQMKLQQVWLCEVTYAKQPRALIQRLKNWRTHWDTINQTLKEDTFIDKDWPVIPWVFGAPDTLKVVEPVLKDLFPEGQTKNLEKVLPWLYCTYDRKEETKQAEEERPAAHV
jgi:hypothetical protein